MESANNFFFEESSEVLVPDVVPTQDFDYDEGEESEKEAKEHPELRTLPSFYQQSQLENDTLQMFLPKNEEFEIQSDENPNPQPLSEQSRNPLAWETNPKQDELDDLQEVDANFLHQFFEEVPLTKGFSDIMKATDYNSEESAYYFLLLMKIEEGRNPKISLNSLLQRFLRKCRLGFDLLGNSNVQASDKHLDIKMLDRIDKTQEILRKIQFKFEHVGQQTKRGSETFIPADDIEPRKIRNWSEPILSTDLILSDDEFYHRLVRNDLTTIQHFKYEIVPRTFVMLIDVSYSMNKQNRMEYACASAICFVKNALEGANRGIIVLFDSEPHDEIEFNTVQDAIKYFLSVPFSGGGTSIDNALTKADEFNPDEIILITDGEDNIHYIPENPVYTIFCDPDSNSQLKRISQKYENYQLSSGVNV